MPAGIQPARCRWLQLPYAAVRGNYSGTAARYLPGVARGRDAHVKINHLHRACDSGQRPWRCQPKSLTVEPYAECPAARWPPVGESKDTACCCGRFCCFHQARGKPRLSPMLTATTGCSSAPAARFSGAIYPIPATRPGPSRCAELGGAVRKIEVDEVVVAGLTRL
jgi:hypothetical protein